MNQHDVTFGALLVLGLVSIGLSVALTAAQVNATKERRDMAGDVIDLLLKVENRRIVSEMRMPLAHTIQSTDALDRGVDRSRRRRRGEMTTDELAAETTERLRGLGGGEPPPDDDEPPPIPGSVTNLRRGETLDPPDDVT